jgi:hypothetical protein
MRPVRPVAGKVGLGPLFCGGGGGGLSAIVLSS